MRLTSDFRPLQLSDLRKECAYLKAESWRFVQILANVSAGEGNDLYYSFMKDGELRNYFIEAVPKSQEVPSISDLFLASFVFENEARELFGVNMGPIVIDFAGAMYAPAVDEPMTIMSPEQKEALDKLRKANAAKAAKAAKEAAATGGAADGETAGASDKAAAPSHKSASKKGGLTEAQREAIRQKIATLPADKAARLQAVLDRDLNEENVRNEAQNTAAKVEGNTPHAVVGDGLVVSVQTEAPRASAGAASEKDEPLAEIFADERLEQLISLMDEDRAKIVESALATARRARTTSTHNE